MRGTCSCHRILWNLYCRRNQCHRILYGPADLTVEVINVHVPSRKKKLIDEQSKILLRSLLQSNSDSMPGQTVGSARFLIGGDITWPSIATENVALPSRNADDGYWKQSSDWTTAHPCWSKETDAKENSKTCLLQSNRSSKLAIRRRPNRFTKSAS